MTLQEHIKKVFTSLGSVPDDVLLAMIYAINVELSARPDTITLYHSLGIDKDLSKDFNSNETQDHISMMMKTARDYEEFNFNLRSFMHLNFPEINISDDGMMFQVGDDDMILTPSFYERSEEDILNGIYPYDGINYRVLDTAPAYHSDNLLYQYHEDDVPPMCLEDNIATPQYYFQIINGEFPDIHNIVNDESIVNHMREAIRVNNQEILCIKIDNKDTGNGIRTTAEFKIVKRDVFSQKYRILVKA